MGRNIFQAEDPVSMIKAVRAVVHEKHTPDEAFALYGELKKKGK
jgi:putative autoinducer-2 (AI-2) aldolase